MLRRNPVKKFKVLYNACYGGFSLSKQAVTKLKLAYGINVDVHDISLSRHDFRLINLFEQKGSEWMSGECAEIRIVECEADGYSISENDGLETVTECYADFVLV